MPKKQATGEEIVEHFASLPKGAGSAEARVIATARYFQVKPETVHRHLKFWWPGKTYLKEFGTQKSRVKWDRPTQEILKALNDEGSIAKAAKSLKTTTVTLTKAIQRHHIIQRWVVEKDGEGAGANGQHASRRDGDLIQA